MRVGVTFLTAKIENMIKLTGSVPPGVQVHVTDTSECELIILFHEIIAHLKRFLQQKIVQLSTHNGWQHSIWCWQFFLPSIWNEGEVAKNCCYQPTEWNGWPYCWLSALWFYHLEWDPKRHNDLYLPCVAYIMCSKMCWEEMLLASLLVKLNCIMYPVFLQVMVLFMGLGYFSLRIMMGVNSESQH